LGRRSGQILLEQLPQSGTAGNLAVDAHLAALAIGNRAVLVSFDPDFSRFKGLRWEKPE
jgi:predicted nucleic acid-binding protein